MSEPKLYRCCKTCEFRDSSYYYGCSKANVCYNGFSAYQPNAEMRAFEAKMRAFENEPASAANDTSSKKWEV